MILDQMVSWDRCDVTPIGQPKSQGLDNNNIKY